MVVAPEGGSAGAEPVSLCENPVLGRCPFLPQRSQSGRGGKSVDCSVCCAPSGPGTMRPVPSEAKQGSQGYQATL